MLIDQNYANNIMFMVFSTLESLSILEDNNNLSKIEKVYKHYDKQDYSDKNAKELLAQLQIHILNFETSKKMFEAQHGKYVLPAQFSSANFYEEIQNFKKKFPKNPTVRSMI